MRAFGGTLSANSLFWLADQLAASCQRLKLRLMAGLLVIIFIVVIFSFAHLDLGLMPNDAAPLIRLTQELQRHLRMCRISLQTNHFGNHSQLFAIIAEHLKVHTTSNRRQLALKM